MDARSAKFLILIIFAAHTFQFVSTTLPPPCLKKYTEASGPIKNDKSAAGLSIDVCSYQVQVAADSLIKTTFTTADPKTTDDRIYVFDGQTCQLSNWKRLTTKPTEAIITTGNQMSIFTRITQSGQEGILEAQYETVPKTGTTTSTFETKCGDPLTGTTGEIDTEQKKTTADAPCVWKITTDADKQVTLTITKMDTIPAQNELLVFDGSDCGSQLLKYATKTTYSNSEGITSSGNVLTVVSISTTTQSPFIAKFTAAPQKPTTAPQKPTTVATTTTTGDGTILRAAGFPIISCLVSTLWCTFP